MINDSNKKYGIKFLNYLSRIKYYLLISTIIFVLSIVLGVLFSDVFQSVMMETMGRMVDETTANGITFQSIFFNNIFVNLMMVSMGFLFSVISLFSLIFNGLLIGFVYTLTNPVQFLLYIIPHGVFELPAIVLSFATSLLVTKFTIILIKGFFYRNRVLKEEIYKSKQLIKDILFSIFFITVLLVIAAFIEVYITIDLANLILSFL